MSLWLMVCKCRAQGGGGRWQGESQIETGCADELGAVKDGHEIWTKDQSTGGPAAVADTFGQRQVQEYMGDDDGVMAIGKGRTRIYM